MGLLILVPSLLPTPAVFGEALAEIPQKTAIDRAQEKSSDITPDETLLLEVTVNGYLIGKIGEFTLRQGKLMARSAELRDLGFRVPVSLALNPDGMVALSDLRGLTWSIDQRNQALLITAGSSSLLPTLLMPNRKEGSQSSRVIESGTGLTLNYDVAGTLAGGQNGATASLDLRGFSAWGIVSSDWLAYAGAALDSSGKNREIRLDSAYTFADVKNTAAL